MIPRAAGQALGLSIFLLLTLPQQGVDAQAHAAPAPQAVQQKATDFATVRPAMGSSYNNYGLDREVFGFATAGSLGDPTIGYPSWNFNLLSTVAFFSIDVKYTGELIADSNWTVWNSSTLTNFVATAHLHGVKVVVTLRNAWSDTVDFCDMLYNGQTTVDQIVTQVVQKGIDGVNIDYEGQLAQCHTTNPGFVDNVSDQSLLTAFAQNMRAGLDAAKPGYYLSIDTYSGSAAGSDGFFNIPALDAYVDSFFVMAYDMDYSNQPYAPLSCSSFCMAPVSPLTNYYWNDTVSMNQYVAAVGASKVILGQPYYGRVACVQSGAGGPGPHAVAASHLAAAAYLDAADAEGSPDVKPGTYVIHRDANDPTGWDRWDTWYDLSLNCWREMYWGDVTQLGTRYNLVNQDNLRGVGFWTLNYGGGASELWDEIQTYFVSCLSNSVTGNPASPQLSATPVQVTATAGPCVNARYEFWYLAPGGKWTDVQPYSSASVYNWKTSGLAPGVYHFSVWARDAKSRGLYGAYPSSYDGYATLDYTVTTQPCTSVSATPAPASPSSVGAPITVTATAGGCPSPQYEFWVRAPGGAWKIARTYASSNVLSWSTLGGAAGTYEISVWVRDTSSLGTSGAAPNTYDAFTGLSYALTPPACAGATATPAPASPADIGTSVTVTASASAPGCPNPRYEFWLRAPGGAWSIVQPYSPTATFTWSSLGSVPGTYQFSVWVRDASSTAAYDSFAAFAYALNRQPCASASTTASPATSTTAGTTVTISASAASCPNAQFEFWMLAPGGSWRIVQPYSPTATYVWTTTGLATGTYQFSVWARDTSSTGAYDSYSAFPYALN